MQHKNNSLGEFMSWKVIIAAIVLFLLCCVCGFFFLNNTPHISLATLGTNLPESLVEKFKKKYGCDVAIDVIDTKEAFLSKLAMNTKLLWDVVLISQSIIEQLSDRGLLEDIDYSIIEYDSECGEQIPYCDAVIDVAKCCCAYSVPYTMAGSALMVHKDIFDTLDHSWNILFDSSTYKKSSVLKDARSVIGAMLKGLGYSANTTDSKELLAVIPVLKDLRSKILKIDSDWTEHDLLSGNTCVSHAENVCDSNKLHDKMMWVVPKEGIILNIDCFAIIKSSSKKELAYKFINFLLKQQQIKSVCAQRGIYPVVQNTSIPSMEDAVGHTIFDKSEALRYLGKSESIYNNIWTMFVFNVLCNHSGGHI